MEPNFLAKLLPVGIGSVICYRADRSNYPMDNWGRHMCGMIYTVEGTEIYHFASGDRAAAPGTVLFIPKGEVYTIDFEGETSVAYVINFELSSAPAFEPTLLRLPAQGSMPTLLMEAERCWQRKQTGYEPESLAYFFRIIAVLERLESTYIHPTQYERIAKAVDYLHEHYTEQNFRVGYLSELSGITPKYFSQLFRKKFGASPKEYVTRLKIERARELLADDKLRISQIAQVLGFRDVYHFSKVFHTETGESPMHCRAGYRTR